MYVISCDLIGRINNNFIEVHEYINVFYYNDGTINIALIVIGILDTYENEGAKNEIYLQALNVNVNVIYNNRS